MVTYDGKRFSVEIELFADFTTWKLLLIMT